MVLVILLMFAMFGAMFFMTFYLENVHGLSPIGRRAPAADDRDADRRLPARRSGDQQARPRLPIATGMLLAAVAMLGLSRLGAASSPNDTIAWFVLLGLGLSPVMVGATNPVIVGNAPVALAGVASGLQSTAMQLGGTLGTAVLGAIMSAKISTLLPASWHAAHLPALSTAQLAQVKSAVSVGAAPVTRNTPPQLATEITRISHATFVAGMHNAFLVAAAVALAGALIALITSGGTARPTLTPASDPSQPAVSPIRSRLNPEGRNVMSAETTRTPVTPASPPPAHPQLPNPEGRTSCPRCSTASQCSAS